MLPVDISNRIKQGETIEPENFDEVSWVPTTGKPNF